jgi:cytochrome c biogenesis protein CcmG/thiol:disulfide interchange protein DsbE
MNRNVLLFGTVITAALVGVLFLGLGKDPSHIDSPLVGKPAPPFAEMEKFRGKPMVINFWATWCRPCWEEHPALTAASRAFGDRVQFLGVVFQDDETKIQDFLRQRGAAYPTVIDQGGKTAIAYGVGGIPETFFIDANGTIVAKYDGPLSPELLQSYLEKVLGP